MFKDIYIKMKSIKQLVVILLLFAASISGATCAELHAGNAKFDLGDGYIASFVLPDIGTPYVLDYAYTGGISENVLLKAYGFTISSNGADLASLTMDVWVNQQFQPIPKASTEASLVPETFGPRIITPKTISVAPGYVGYDLQIGATGTDKINAMTGFFTCFPGARTVSDSQGKHLVGIIEVNGETSGLQASVQSLKVFNPLVDSIKISGPGISKPGLRALWAD
jgi:hypothetical protein